ncbi:MAG TPA: hypothetical protein VM865_07565 [Acidobacteriaceae bacterium]|jgi:hypothetical protein|nr:hypothetical protein [Acidobacteriaceae bacterium]
MDTRSASPQDGTVTWPLGGSFLLTGVVVAFVCAPPTLHSWKQLLLLACFYLLVAACVHTLAVMVVYRLQRGGGSLREWVLLWPTVWGAWIAVVWLPLAALLTNEHSRWISVVLPVTAVFAVLYARSRQALEEAESDGVAEAGRVEGSGLFVLEEPAPLWRVLLPCVLTAVALEGAMAMLGAEHAWIAGALLACAAAYVTDRLLKRTVSGNSAGRDRTMRQASTGNSVAVWMLTVLALLPFLAGVTSAVRGIMGMPAAVQAAPHAPRLPSGGSPGSSGYTGVILTLPRKPREVIAPRLGTHVQGFSKSRLIPFDGTYWYFKSPDTRPAPNARVVQGDPLKRQIRSADALPLLMEAHQPLGDEMEMSCCRTLQLNLVNADAVPGTIALEAVLRDTSGRTITAVALGSKVLPSSTVSPMPLHREPVHETMVFAIPRSASGRRFDEITVRLKPERTRWLAGPHVSIESFLFER